MSKMHRYEVTVTEEKYIEKIREVFRSIGLNITQEFGLRVTGKDAMSAGEYFSNPPEYVTGDYIYFSQVESALEPYAEYIEELEYYSENDTSGSRNTTRYIVEDGEFVEK